MEHSCKASQFYVVHFIEKPFEGIDYYVCVPYTWLLHRYEENKNLLVVAYPTNENPLVTRKRVQKKEERQGGISGWQFCKAKLEYPSDNYKDAERWISQKKNLRPLVQDNSKTTQNKPWDYELRYGYQKYFSDSQDKSARVGTPNRVPRKQLPNAKDKKSLEKEKKKHFLGQLERKETAKSTVQNTSAEPVSSTIDQSITIGDKQPIENTATNNSPNTEDSTRIKKQNNHINSEKVLIIDLDEDSKANIEDHSHQEQHSETRNQNQLAAPKSPSSVEQTPQNQHYNRRLRIKDIQNLTALSNNQELRVNNISNERPPTFQHNMSSSASNSAEFWNQNQNSTKNMPIRPQNVLIPVELTKQLPRPLNQDLRDNDVSNENTFTFHHNMASSLSNTAELRNQNQNSAKNLSIRPQNVLISVDVTKQLPKLLNQDLRVDNISNERPPTFQHNMSSSASNSAEFWNQNQNTRRNMPITPQNVLIPADLTKQLPKPLNQDLRVNNISNERPPIFQHYMSSSASNSAEFWNQNQNSAKNMSIRPQNILIPVDITKQLPKHLNQDLRVNDISNERPPTFQHMSSSASNSAEFWNQNQNSTKNMPIRWQNVLIPVYPTQQLPKPLNQDLRVNDISNERPPTFQHMSSSASNSAEFWNQNQNSTKNMPIRRQNVLIPVHPTLQLPKPLNQDLRVNYISNERPPTFQHNMSSSASNSAEFWNQNQNNRRNMPIRKQNALIPIQTITKIPTKPNHYENSFQPLNQEIRFNNVSNERLFTGQHHMLSSLSMSAELLNQNQNSRRNVPIRPKNDSIPVDLIKHLPKPLTKSLTANKARQGTSLLITNINCTRVESMGISSQDIQHVAAMIPVPATSRGVASVTSPKSLEVNHEQLGFVPQIVQQNLPYPQEQKQTREQDLDQRQPVFCENRFAPRRLESYPSEVTQHQAFRPSFNNVLTNVPSQLYQPLDIQHREQRVVSHENAQQRPAIILRKNNRRSPDLQGVKKITPPPALPRAPKSITQVLVNSLKNDRWNEPELQEILNAILKHQTSSGVINALPSISSSAHTNHYPHDPEPMGSSYKSSSEPPPVYENFDQNLRLQTQVLQSDGTNSTRKRFHFQDKVEKATKQTIEESECPKNLDMEEPLSLPYGTPSGSGIDTDHEAVSGSKMLVDEALEAANEIDQTENNSMDRSRNSLSELALQQQMVEKMSTACMTLNSSLKSATNILDNFRDSFLKIAKSLQTSSDNNQRFDTLENSAYHAPSSSNVKQEIPPVVKRRQISAPERRNSSNRNLQNVNKASARIYKKNSGKYPRYGLRFVLPSEYDANNTNWTLKYQEGMSGVVELMPKSKIYVKLKELKRCERVSTSCELLAQLMLHEVFNEKALGVCATITETARARSKSSPDARPPLDNHGSLVLLNYVIQYAIDSDWNLNLRNILKTLDIEMRKIQLNGLKSRLELDDCKLFQNRLKKLV